MQGRYWIVLTCSCAGYTTCWRMFASELVYWRCRSAALHSLHVFIYLSLLLLNFYLLFLKSSAKKRHFKAPLDTIRVSFWYKYARDFLLTESKAVRWYPAIFLSPDWGDARFPRQPQLPVRLHPRHRLGGRGQPRAGLSVRHLPHMILDPCQPAAVRMCATERPQPRSQPAQWHHSFLCPSFSLFVSSSLCTATSWRSWLLQRGSM